MSRCLSLFLPAVVLQYYYYDVLTAPKYIFGLDGWHTWGWWRALLRIMGLFKNLFSLLQFSAFALYRKSFYSTIRTLFFKSVKKYQLTSDLDLNHGVYKFFLDGGRMVLSGVGGGEAPRYCAVEIEQRRITLSSLPFLLRTPRSSMFLQCFEGHCWNIRGLFLPLFLVISYQQIKPQTGRNSLLVYISYTSWFAIFALNIKQN